MNKPITIRGRIWKTIRTILAYAFVFGIGYSFHGCAPKSECGVSKASWMPSGASDGAYAHGQTFILGPPSYFYEYTISEADFRREAERMGFPLSEVVEAKHVLRYLSRHVRPNEFDEDRERLQEITSAKITSGLIYEELHSGDVFTAFAYDRKRSRAYIHYSTR
jgi:hypothetical protein